MKRKTKFLSALLAVALSLGTVGMVGPIGLFPASAAEDTAGPGTLSFNLRAVNLLSGADKVDADSELTIQYTDASLGDNLEMYVSISTTKGTVLVEKQRVESASLRVENRNVFVDNENPSVSKDIYSNVAGSVTFNPALDMAYSVNDLIVTVWIEDSANAAKFSNRATTTINNGFFDGVPSSITGSNWMNYIDGAMLLSQINMPGTHDAVTQYIDKGGILTDYNTCQNTNIGEQLKMGVRYLDIRCDTKNTTKDSTVNGKTVNDFGVSHSSYPAYTDSAKKNKMLFSDVYNWCKEFLTTNPSETIFMTINDENTNGRPDLMARLLTFVNADPGLFYTKSNEIPTLDDVRGKIVLVRRFPGDYAGDNGAMDFFWQDKCNDTEHPVIPVSSSIAVTTYFVQDNYGLAANSKRTTAVNYLRTAESRKQANQYYINFFSTAPTLTSPSSSAKTVNSYFESNANLQHGAQYGYLIFDFITKEISKTVYETNIFTTEPQVQANNNEKTDKVVLHYDFGNVVNGKVPDTTGNGFDGTLVNSGNLSVNSTYNTLTFNNVGKSTNTGAGYVEIPQSVFRGTGDTATIQFWMKENGPEGRNTLLSIGNNTNGIGQNYLVVNTKWDGRGPRFAIKTTKVGGGGVEKDPTASNTISQNTWHLLTYVIDGDTIKIYADDALIQTGETNANFNDLTGSTVYSPIRLGAAGHFPTDESFTGTMGEFTIYNYAVSGDEIAQKYADLTADPTLNGMTLEYNDVSEGKIDQAAGSVYLKVGYDLDLTDTYVALDYTGKSVQFAADGSNFSTVPANGRLDLSDKPTIRVVGGLETVKVYTIQIERYDPIDKNVSAEDVAGYVQIKDNAEDSTLRDIRVLVEAPSAFLKAYDEAVLTVTFKDAEGKTISGPSKTVDVAYTSVIANGERVKAKEGCGFIGIVITHIPADITMVSGEISFTINGQTAEIQLGSARIG